jgi:hypothetical protein
MGGGFAFDSRHGHTTSASIRVKSCAVSRRVLPRFGALALGALAIAACSSCDPIVTIAGANFPSWLLCMIVGAVIVAAIRPLLVIARLEPHLAPLTIFYPSLIAMFAMIVWAIFFNRV